MVMGRALLVGAMIGAGLIYLLSLGLGLWVAYDRWLALPRFGLLLGGALLLGAFPWRAMHKGERKVTIMAAGCSWVAGTIGLFFLLTHDWRTTAAIDFQPLAVVTGWVQRWQPPLGAAAWLAPLRLHENAVAGALIILLPIGYASCREHWQRHRISAGVSEGLALTLAAFALVLTFSRGAWAGFGVGIALTYIAANADHWLGTIWTLLCSTLVVGAALITFLVTPAALTLLMRSLQWSQLGGTATSRLMLWQDAVTVAPDYWFTGSGLQSTAMVLSTYVYLLHVPYLAHGHNLYLQLALEQGAPTLVAFVLFTIGLLWFSRAPLTTSTVGLGATAGLLALLVHGWFDAELYSSYLAPLLFLPLGLVGSVVPQSLQQRHGGVTWIGVGIPVVIVLLFAGRIGLPSLLLANRAAVMQTRTELSRYHWPAWPLQDAVRQQMPAKFAAITALYRAALQHDPTNVTAQRRLGQILLSQNDYTGAQRHLEAAYRLALDQRATRQLLGEVYALTGKANAARMARA
jgi:hypothetical protein